MEENIKYLLWENVSSYIEKVEELHLMMNSISYIDDKMLERITRCEVFDTEDFYIISMKEEENVIQVKFEMPFILSCWENENSLLRVTACVNGACEIPSERSYDYAVVDFSEMNKKELLSYGNMISIHSLEYVDVEVDEYGW